jgi:hypothetical protein
MIRGQVAQHLGHSRSKPPIPPPPEKRNIRRMMKKPIRLLKFVDVRHHLGRAADFP